MSFDKRKIRVGKVVGNKMSKTVTVVVERRSRHPLYGKSIRHRTKFKAHDENDTCQIGDLVQIMETRPLSKTKRWRIVEILERKEIADIQPSDIALDEDIAVSRLKTKKQNTSETATEETVETKPTKEKKPNTTKAKTKTKTEVASEQTTSETATEETVETKPTKEKKPNAKKENTEK